MKNENGITLISLVVIVVIIIILSSIAIGYGTRSLDTVELQNFNYELQQVQGKVDIIHEKIKSGNEEYLTIGKNMTEEASSKARETLKKIRGIDYENIDLSSENIENYYSKEEVTSYRYFTEEDLKNELDITSNPGDMIINFETREAISVDGFEYEGKLYYCLKDMN